MNKKPKKEDDNAAPALPTTPTPSTPTTDWDENTIPAPPSSYGALDEDNPEPTTPTSNTMLTDKDATNLANNNRGAHPDDREDRDEDDDEDDDGIKGLCIFLFDYTTSLLLL